MTVSQLPATLGDLDGPRPVASHRPASARMLALSGAIALALAGCGGAGPDAAPDGAPETPAGTGQASQRDIVVGTGTPGLASLVAIVAEPAGANCAQGGSKATAGPDADGDGVLDPAEVTSTGYVCNGATGATTWVEVVDLAVTAQAGRGYLAKAASQVVVTLPASPRVGDVVQVSGLGAGGWKIAQNAGQQIVTQGLPGALQGTPMAEPAQWTAIASSADGTKLLAGPAGRPLETSTDSGRSWTAGASVSAYWAAAASSADGAVLLAAAGGGDLHVSTDGGATWTARESGRDWTGVAVSSDGTRMVAVAWNARVYTSTDSGTTWTPRDGTRLWNGVASSADGTRLAAVAVNDGIYVSDDAGLTWTQRGSPDPWMSVASSADGSRLVAAGSNLRLYTSSDFGATWTAREGSRQWRSVASSADGMRLVAAESAGYASDGALHTSSDAGVTWSSRATGGKRWSRMAMNAAGTRFVGATDNDSLFSFSSRTTLGAAGSVSGALHDSIALQHAGAGLFIPIAAVKYEGGFLVE